MHSNSFSFPRFLNESRALLRLSLPIIITQLATNAMGFVDTSMAGQASARDLAAIAVGTSLWLPASLLLRGILMMLTPVIAHHRGADNQTGISVDFGQALWIALLSAMVLIAYLTQSENILTFMNVDPDVVPIGVGYLHALAMGVPGIALFYTINSFLEGMGDTRAPMVMSLLGLLINIPVNYLLIYGKLGLPELGAVGCGWATGIVYWLMSLMMIFYINTRHRYKIFMRPKRMLPDFRRMSELFRLGLPIGINVFVTGSIFAVIALLIGKLGASNIASAQIALNFSSMTYMIPMSLSFGITIRVGHALGQTKMAEARLRSITGILLAGIIAMISSSALLLFPEQIISLYTRDPEIAQMAAALLVFTAIYQFSDAIQAAANGALRGYKDTRTPMLLACVAYWGIALPLGYTTAMTDLVVPALGVRGFWVGIVTGLTLSAGFMLIRLIWKMRTVESQSSIT
ncbi:multidrug transporter MatE [Endozoicomonas montiporae]|uniref:Multidrug-efflux transporter n=2 Tax=Endozoicomonas montiporae TaxID=1027273 RepID=A0A081N4U7_9GAMM|nr:MATE family efflux transporter [Endozoicomonas montiporae]AMO57657.1 multidrug resistance protein [Endozoicomonas montiporae CL-33]KEQ13470.1 multidrug transporter MatE [Endozoicomonas montiporae]